MTRHAAMNVLYQTIAALDAQIASLNTEREQARTALSALVEAEGGKVVFAGIATLEITRPTVIASYDRAGIEGIVRNLLANGHRDIAAALEGHRKESHRVGSLRITKAKATTVETTA